MSEPWGEKRWGPLSEENMRQKLIEDGYTSVFCYRYPKGTVFAKHTHPVDKKDAVLEGEFAITMNGEEFLLRAGDVIQVPSNTIHKAEVRGDILVVSQDATRG
jgi:quercetin dioxygenase-like cupin family protein